MPKQTKSSARVRMNAKVLYEVDGESFSEIGRRLGFGNQTIAKWAKADGGWLKPGGTSIEEVVVEPFTVEEDEEVVQGLHDTIDRGEADLRDRLATLEAENARLEAANAELKPTRDIQAMLDDRVKWLTDNSPEGDKYWINRAEASFKNENRQRAKDGLPIYNIRDNPEMLDDLINDLKTKAASLSQRPIMEPPSRKIKLFIMRNGMPTVEQIPMEGQINNMAGSLADGIVRYTRKGFKLTNPFLCPRAGCFQPAESDAYGKWMHEGYCTEAHRLEVEGQEKSPTVGVSIRDVVPSGV